METRADKVARSLRPYLFGACIVAIPIAFISYLAMAALALGSWPLWLVPIIGLAHAICWIAVSMFHDSQSERIRQLETLLEQSQRSVPDCR